VLFLHGFTDSSYSFSPVLPLLPASIRAFVHDQRGHGDSDRPARGYSMSDFADDAVALLDCVGVRRATVVGHSMGGLVAQRVAVDYPDRVERLVLIGTATGALNEAVLGLREQVQALTDPVPAEFVRDFQLGCAHRPLPQAFLDNVVAESRKLPARLWREVLDGILSAGNGEDLHRVSAPTLVLWGDRDRFARRTDQDALVAGIAGSRLAVYEGTGHALHWEEPERFAVELTSFVEGVAGRDAVAGSGREKQAGRLHSLGAST
jgi:pimeloyl-ACP methyl ester carboxylesterase